MPKTKKFLVGLCAPLMALTIALPALAETGSSSDDNPQSKTAKQEVEKKLEAAKKNLDKKSDDTKESKLDSNKLTACKGREKNITSQMSKMATRGQERIDLFTKIAERTETFYVQKGKTLSSYDDLVAAVNSKKASAQAAVDSVVSASANFSCQGDPKDAAGTFKSNIKAMNSALKEYKTAVKNLIVGVKSVQSTTKAEASG